VVVLLVLILLRLLDWLLLFVASGCAFKGLRVSLWTTCEDSAESEQKTAAEHEGER